MSFDLSDMPELRQNINWWQAKDDHEVHTRLLAWYQKLRNDDTDRLELIRRHMRMYGNSPVGSLGLTSAHLGEDRVRLNVIKSAADTVTAKITKNKPRPTPVNTAGNWSLRRKAKFLENFFEAQFYISKVDHISVQVFLDACVMGTGVMKVYDDRKKIVAERVWPGELFVDAMDGLYQDPNMVVQRKFMDRNVLSKMYPKHKLAIANARRFDDHGDELGYDDHGDQVLVLEAWRRPSYEGEKDGKHVIIVDGATLLSEPWAEQLPFVFLRWSEPLRGFWGIGLAEELVGLQVEINRLLQKIQAAMHLVAVPRVFVEEGSRVQKSYLDNKIGRIIPFRGQKPIFEVTPSVHPEMFTHLNNLYQRAFEIAGVSLMSAGSNKPAGLESGAALRTFHDIETERFATIARQWEQMFVQMALLMATVAKRIGGPVMVQKGKYSLSRVDWSEIDMEADSYVMRVWPASSLPSTPAGRLAAVEEMIQAQIITAERGKQLLDFQDLDKELLLDRAASDNIDRVIEKMLDKGEYEAPEPTMDLELALRKVQAEYNRVLDYDDIPEERLDHLRLFMNTCHRMLKAAMAEQAALQAAPAPGAPPPPGPNGAPPTAVQPSDGALNV